MSEEKETSESGCEAEGGLNPVAVALALGGASREEADNFLRNQNALIADQRHHLHEQFKHLHLSVWEKQLGVALRLATIIVGIAFAVGVGVMVWDAAHSNGLIIEPFSVPPDLAAKGLSGEVAAGQLLDKLTAMQNATTSSRPPQSYGTNWGSDLKVEIPETGVSLGELRRFLREWLGHDTHITGEIWHTDTGLAIAARAGGQSGAAITGTLADFGGLIQKAAEQVYGSTQPYRYANFLDRNYRPGAELRVAEAEAIYRKLIYDRDPVERAWAWNGLGTIAYSQHGDVREAIRHYHKAISVQPDFDLAYNALISQEAALGHAEESLANARKWQSLVQGRPERVRGSNGRPVAELLGDFAEVARICMESAGLPNDNSVQNHDLFQDCAGINLARQHDGPAARAWLRDMPPVEAPPNNGRRANSRLGTAAFLEEWKTVIATEADAEKAWISWLPGFDRITLRIRMRPLLALAKAKLGDVSGGQVIIAATPGDCYDCLQIRGQIAEMAKQHARADWWFARAAAAGPSLPFAEAEWGKALLARGKPDHAIEKFKLANQKGPKFADPLEGWGEALMAKNQSHLALEKFAEAEKYAPNWGRLHLKWGEALVYAGKMDEAKAQFARAAQLDLTPSEKVELVRMR